MTRNNTTGGASASMVRSAPRRQVLATACAIALFATAANAQQAAEPAQQEEQQAQQQEQQAQQPVSTAQQEPDVSTLETIHVTGIRAAIASAVQNKLDSTSIIESISAEDLGKLPDISIADSISRLPGVATQRVAGRSQVIQIRGMSEQFAGTTLNGREQVTTGDNRGVEFDQYPAELISGVDLYKTPDATLIGQGISGTVDLKTVRPLSFGERRFVTSAQGEYNDLGNLMDGGKDKGYRVSASYVDQFADDTFGIAIGYARLSSPFQEQHYKAWWWANINSWGSWAPAQPGKPADAISLQGAENWVKSRDLTRDGLMAVAEYKPNDTFHSTLDLYYTQFDQDDLMRGVMWSSDPWANGGQVTYTGATTTTVSGGDKLVTGGTLNNVRPVVRNDHDKREDTIFSAGWNNEVTLDAWKLTADLSYSRAETDRVLFETTAGPAGGQDIAFRLPTSPDFAWFSTVGLDDPNTILLSDPGGWGREGKMERTQQEDTLKAARLEAEWTFESPIFTSLQFGANFNHREKTKSFTTWFAQLKNDATEVAVAPGDLKSPTSLDFSGLGGVLSYDPYDLLAGGYYDLVLNDPVGRLTNSATVEENVDTYYAQLNLDTDLTDGIRLRGNAGLQYASVDQESSSFNVVNGRAVPVTLGAKYFDVLPSLNLVADFGDGWIVRFGAATTMMRPPIAFMSASNNARVATTGAPVWSGGGGNPTLQPWKADAGDLSFEKYFGESSYVGLAVFYKDLQHWIRRQTVQNWDFTGYPNDSGIEPISNFGNFSTWVTEKGGYMRGAELSTNIEGGLFHDALSPFGVQFSASYTESSIKPNGPGTTETETLPGLSKIVANLTAYYENKGWSVRLSERYRDSFRGEFDYLFGNRSVVRSMSETQVDAQVAYEFGETTSLKGLQVMFQVNNVTDSPFRTVQDGDFPGGAMAPQEYNEYGRQYLLGFRYKL